MYNLERVQNEVLETFKKANVSLLANVPIQLNGRLTRCLGRVMYRSISGKTYPTRIEFSKLLLEDTHDETIHQVILHECAHYIAWYRTGERHGHDAMFKQICAEIGCTNDGAKCDVEELRTAEKHYKYAIYCPNCGFIGGMSRWGSTLENLPYCTCKKCGSEELSYVQNW